MKIIIEKSISGFTRAIYKFNYFDQKSFFSKTTFTNFPLIKSTIF